MVVRRKTTTSVSARTMRKRARKTRAIEAEKTVANAAGRTKRHTEPETIVQARTWDRKRVRYLIVGLCPSCAAHAAYGHALGFGNIPDPCAECQSIVDTLPTPAGRKLKWRKQLQKLEYTITPDERNELLCRRS